VYRLRGGVARARIALLLAACLPAVAQAQAPASSPAIAATRNFPPEFFAQYAPVTALDMVERIPGFSIEEGEERRGFGENLIDGDRVSTKSEPIRDILARIPASQVERIELSEQAGADGETRGAGQIVNIVRKGGAAVSGTYEGNVRFGPRYGVTPFTAASATLKRGATTYELNARSFDEKVRGKGPEDFKNGSRQLVERRFYVGTGRFREHSVGGAIKTQAGAAKINANAKFTLRDGIDRRLGVYSGAAGEFRGSERLFTDQPKRDPSYEIGGDVEFPLGRKVTSKLIGLYRFGEEKFDGLLEQTRPGQPTSLFLTRTINKPAEAVLRSQNDWRLGDHAVQFGVELAYNRLDASFRGDSTSGGAPTQVSTFDVLVRETRVEPFVSDVWTLSPQWKLEGGVIAEFSRLRLTGDSQERRSFQFLKPRLAATWTPNPLLTMEFRAENQVAQLDFDEFATNVDLAQSNQVDQGNRDLVPEKTTTLSALIRRKFFDRGSIQLLGQYVFVSDTQDLVPVDLGGGVFVDGAGNIGSSRRWNAELEITLPLDWATKGLGIKGMEIKYIGHYHGSRVTDPVTGEKRRRSFTPEYHQDFIFRHDFPKAGVAYGFTVRQLAPYDAYFVNLFRSEREAFEIDNAFMEYRKLKIGTIRLSVFDLVSGFRRSRFFYQGTRASGVLTQIIDRKRRLDPRIQIGLSGKF
jgi:hypothetical protein